METKGSKLLRHYAICNIARDIYLTNDTCTFGRSMKNARDLFQNCLEQAEIIYDMQEVRQEGLE